MSTERNRHTEINPFRSSLPVLSATGRSDALSRCSASLSLIADLFGGEKNSAGYELLATPKARFGVWTQLTAMSEMLEHLAENPVMECDEALLYINSEDETEEELLDYLGGTSSKPIGRVLRRSGYYQESEANPMDRSL